MSLTLVAEIGQNHQSSPEVAKDLIELAACPRLPSQRGVDRPEGFDAVKFCLRDNEHEGTADFMDRPYSGRQSFGDTYRDHRETLELSDAEIAELCEYARSKRLDVGLTICHPSRLSVLERCSPDWLKVASRDLTNLPLLRELAGRGYPVVISTGMATHDDLERALRTLHEAGQSLTDVVVLHCVSSYPAEASDVNLRTIRWLKRNYGVTVGYSDHTTGVWAGPAAVAMGAEWIEAHITLWRGSRGSDHEGALGPEGCWRYVRDCREAERALGRPGMVVPDSVEKARRKLERSIAFSKDLEPGTLIGSSNTELLSPGTGIPWTERDEVFGRRLAEPAKGQTLVSSTQLEGV